MWAMNIRQCRGNSILASESFPYIVPASQVIFLAVGMLVPATDRRGLGGSRGEKRVSNEDAERLRAERNAKRRAHYRANREKILAYQAAYREANREKLKADHQAYYDANRERLLAAAAARRAARKQPR